MSGATYATGKPYPPRSEWVPRIFFREGCFYMVELAEDDDLAEHVRLNPGTLRIEDIHGNQLWPPPLASADTHAKRGDAKQAPSTMSGAVPHEDAGDAQNAPQNPSQPTPGTPS